MENPCGVSQALREQSGMSTPIPRGAVDNSVRRNHLLSEEIDQQQGCVAFRAVTAQADGPAEQIALWAAPLADEAFTAALALVDGLRHHRAAALELLTQTLQIGQAGLVSEAESTLLVGPRAIARWTGWPTPRIRSSSRDPATAPSSLPNTASLRTSHDLGHRYAAHA